MQVHTVCRQYSGEKLLLSLALSSNVQAPSEAAWKAVRLRSNTGRVSLGSHFIGEYLVWQKPICRSAARCDTSVDIYSGPVFAAK